MVSATGEASNDFPSPLVFHLRCKDNEHLFNSNNFFNIAE